MMTISVLTQWHNVISKKTMIDNVYTKLMVVIRIELLMK
ncbi:hypothetical protein vcoNHCC006C_001700 [Vibrio cholerae O1 str. NHCC-006C]|nr:hypothetical protein vcoNHCC006C_001700 [Vibrio cholerae O1 str. NHCC-006C]